MPGVGLSMRRDKSWVILVQATIRSDKLLSGMAVRWSAFPLGGTRSSGVAINDAGQATGKATLAGDLETHAFLWDGEAIIDLGTLGGIDVHVREINASGQVTGQSHVAFGIYHAFLWNGSTMLDLGTLGGNNSERGRRLMTPVR